MTVSSGVSQASAATMNYKPRAGLRTAITVLVVLLVLGGTYGFTLLKSVISRYWLLSSQTSAVLLDLSQKGYEISGSYRYEYLNIAESSCVVGYLGTNPDLTGDSVPRLRTDSGAISGRISGHDVVLNSGVISGNATINHDVMVFADEGCGTLTFRAISSPRSFSSLTKKLANRANALRVLQSKQLALKKIVDELNGDLQTISAPGISSRLNNVSSDLQTVQGDLSTVNGDFSQVQSDVSSQDGFACSDAQGMANDASSMMNDVQTFSQDLNSTVRALDRLDAALVTLPELARKLKAAEAAVPSYKPGDLPSFSTINKAESAGKYIAASTTNEVNGYVGQVNTAIIKAYQELDQAYQAGGCGAPPATPSPIPPISPTASSTTAATLSTRMGVVTPADFVGSPVSMWRAWPDRKSVV